MNTESDADRITKLEWMVVQTAIVRRLRERALFPLGAPESGDGLLNELFVAEQKACDELLEATTIHLGEKGGCELRNKH